MSHRSGSTNLRASAHTTRESGVVLGLDGYVRRGARLNVDHNVGSRFRLGADVYYSQSKSDAFSNDEFPFENIRMTAPDVRLDSLPPDARDPYGFVGVNDLDANPLYDVTHSDLEKRRSRLLGGFTLRWRPAAVLA